MNKFLLIAGNNYDSCHGLEDYAGTYDTFDEAFEAGDKLVECDITTLTGIKSWTATTQLATIRIPNTETNR